MRDPHEFSVGGRNYRAEPMDCFAQQHLARRVQPFILAAMPAVVAAMPGGKLDASALLAMDKDVFFKALGPVSDLLASMTDEAYEAIQSKCLARVSREKVGDTGWAPIWSKQAGRLMFEDIAGHEAMAITVAVLQAELGPFMLGLFSTFVSANQT